MLVHYTHELPMGHRLQNHNGKCKYLHGHNYLVTVHYEGTYDPKSGMVIDFSQLKHAVRVVMDVYDHALALECTDPLVQILAINHAKILEFTQPPTAEHLASVWRYAIASELAVDPHQIHIRVNETRDCAVYI